MNILQRITSRAVAAAVECREIANEVKKKQPDDEVYGAENEPVFNSKLYSSLVARLPRGHLTLEPNKVYQNVDLVYCPGGLSWKGVGKDSGADYLIEVEPIVRNLSYAETPEERIRASERKEICCRLAKLEGLKIKHDRTVIGILIIPFTGYQYKETTELRKKQLVEESLRLCEDGRLTKSPMVRVSLEDGNQDDVSILVC